MEEYYVLNHRLPKFPIEQYGDRSSQFTKTIQESFKKWIVEKVISNLQRRKVCSEIFDFAKWLKTENLTLEGCSSEDYQNFSQDRKGPKVDFQELLYYLKSQLPDLNWKDKV